IAAARQTATMPIVVIAGDVIASGLVTNLAHSEANVTGVTSMARELNPKRLELLKAAIPTISRVAVLWNPGRPSAAISRQRTEAAAAPLGVALRLFAVRDAGDFEAAFEAAQDDSDAMLLLGDPLMTRHATRLADLAVRSRLAAMYQEREFVVEGGLMSY